MSLITGLEYGMEECYCPNWCYCVKMYLIYVCHIYVVEFVQVCIAINVKPYSYMSKHYMYSALVWNYCM